jgi:hypothetical protein
MRETKTIKLTSGKEIVLNTWLTARERRAVSEVTLKHAKFSIETEAGPDGLAQKPVMKEFDAPAAMRDLDELTVKIMVISFDGSDQNVLDRLLDGREADWNEALAAAKGVIANPTAPPTA